MAKDQKRRAARRKLKAHDAGRDRHSKGVEYLKKEQRLAEERARLNMKREPKPAKIKKPKDKLLTRAQRATAEQRARLGE